MPRSYRLHVPPGVTPGRQLPLVLNFHGRTGTAADQESYSGFLPVSDREGFVLVSPDGTGNPRGWSAGATPAGTINDVRFASDLLDTLEREFCLDTTRVFAAGFSNGAFLAAKLGCLMPERVAAVAAVGGVHYPEQQCKAAMPILAFHTTHDDVVPIDGGLVRGWQYFGAYDAISRWATNNGCSPDQVGQVVSSLAVEETFSQCTAPAALVIVNSEGHIWPGSTFLPSEKRTDISAAELIWGFFTDR